jgi:transposase
MAEKDATIADLRELVDELQSLKANLEETLNEFRRQFFGVSSEKTAADKQKSDPSSVSETPAEEPKKIEVKSHTRERKPKSRRSDLYANLPVKEVLISLTDEQRFCDYCNAEMSVISYAEVREELCITPAVVERIRYMQEVAVCPECKKDGDGTLVKSVVPTALMPHSPASPSAVAYVMYHKTFMGTPYYHQEAGMFLLGMKQPARYSVKSFLEGFTGLFQCDGYQGYNKVEDVILVCCLAHCRRKFYEAVPAERRKKMKLLDMQSAEAIPEPIIPEAAELPKLIPAEVGLVYCNKLFFIERQLKYLPADVRKERRLELENPVWDSFWNWLDGITPAGGSKLEKAVNYARNHRETLCNYLLDGRCEISNNAAERRAKSYAIGRKAFLFHTSAAGAGASAVMYSIVETAKANNLNVFQYLYMVLLYMPDYKNEPAGIEMLLPWSDFIKEHCSGLIDVENITPEKHNPLPI